MLVRVHASNRRVVPTSHQSNQPATLLFPLPTSATRYSHSGHSRSVLIDHTTACHLTSTSHCRTHPHIHVGTR